jgi:electron transfer flavoprotein beta subunit
MKIIVAVKQVPVRDSVIHIDSSGKWLEEQDLSFEINEPDAYALEAALLLKEKHGGEVVVLCAGPERAGQSIREALAKGADRAIHIQSGDLVKFDTLGVARLLASAIAAEKADLILTGLQSDDLGLGQTGVVMAELLGIPHAASRPICDNGWLPMERQVGSSGQSVSPKVYIRWESPAPSSIWWG